MPTQNHLRLETSYGHRHHDLNEQPARLTKSPEKDCRPRKEKDRTDATGEPKFPYVPSSTQNRTGPVDASPFWLAAKSHDAAASKKPYIRLSSIRIPRMSMKILVGRGRVHIRENCSGRFLKRGFGSPNLLTPFAWYFRSKCKARILNVA